MQRLIICEKNNAAERIATILSGQNRSTAYINRVPVFKFERDGDTYFVIGLRGHILELDYPKEYNEWNKIEPRELIWIKPIKVTHAKAIVTTLRSIAQESGEIIVATDYDREGEAIGAEALSLLEMEGKILRRAKFSSLTHYEITQAFDNLTDVDFNLAASAEARQEIDLIWGAVLTRSISIASNQMGKNFLSVGRVQSPTLALIVDREKEILNFKPKPYWNIYADVEKDMEFRMQHCEGSFWEEGKAQELYNAIAQEKTGSVSDVEKTEKKERPPPPFDTTQFINAATYLGISAARSMQIAEELYMQGYISYPRTDNTVYPRSLGLKSILKRLTKSEFSAEAEELLARDKIYPTRGRKETTDHPPIHPTDAAPKEKLGPQHWALYELVVRRFFATVAPPATSETINVTAAIGTQSFCAKGYRIIDMGWRKYYPYIKIRESKLPELQEGDQIAVLDTSIEKKETQPPRRYSQGDLILEMERLSLGTKSTRAEIIQKLYDRSYIQGSTIYPTETGIAVIEGLEKHAGEITRSEMTSKLEGEMDSIAEGKIQLDSVVKDSRDMLDEIMKQMLPHTAEMGAIIQEAIKKQNVVGPCSSCGSDLLIMRSGRGKRFIGCSGYPDCKTAYPLPQKGKIEIMDIRCPTCNAPKIRVITRGRPPWELCVNMDCPEKAERKAAAEAKKAATRKTGTKTAKTTKAKKTATKKTAAKKTTKSTATKSAATTKRTQSAATSEKT